MAKTIRDFQVGFDVAPMVDAWAQANHYGFRGVSPDGTRNYQRGHGIINGAMPLTVRQAGTVVHLEAWVLFLMLVVMGVGSDGILGGIIGVVPKSIARGSVNKLLEQLGQPPIA